MKSLLIVSLMFSGLAMASEAVLVKEIRQTANLMPVIGPEGRPIRTTLEVEVASGGCTKAEDFKVVVKKSATNQTLEIVRVRPDFCEAVIHRKAITLETESLNLSTRQPISLLNPLYAEEQVVH